MDGWDWTASAMRAARAQLEIATANLANAGSDGFRRRRAEIALGAHGLDVRARPAAGQGGLVRTGRPFDLALAGPGAFRVGGETTRAGAFTRDRDGRLVDDRGRALRGARGVLRVSPEARIDSGGAVRDGGRLVDRLPLPPGTQVVAGAVESSTVNPIDETLAILTAQRAFETAQRTLGALDAIRAKAYADVARLA